MVRESEALGEGEFAIMQLAVAGGGNLSRASRGERERERYIHIFLIRLLEKDHMHPQRRVWPCGASIDRVK